MYCMCDHGAGHSTSCPFNYYEKAGVFDVELIAAKGGRYFIQLKNKNSELYLRGEDVEKVCESLKNAHSHAESNKVKHHGTP